MKKGKFGIGLFSAVILLAIAAMAIHTAPAPKPDNPVEVRAGAETLDVWTADGETYYGFLPGHVNPDQAVIQPVLEGACLDGEALPLGCKGLEPGRDYSLTWVENGAQRQGKLQLLAATGMPTLYLNTQSGSMAFIHEEKGNGERGTLRLYDEQGNLVHSGGFASLRGRGNSTWVVPEKKPYNLELTEEADLLGMGAAKKWVLVADALDTSALRNRIVLDFAARAGMPYTPEARWAEVYLNGEYAGLYLLCERVEIGPSRLELSADSSLVCLGWQDRIQEDRDPWFLTDNDQCIQIRQTGNMAALKRSLQAMENAILASDDSWQEHIDPDSWVKKYLIEEVFGSYDAGFQSQFYFTAGDGRIWAGPVWDFDAALGNPQVWSLNSPQGLYAWRPAAMAGIETPWLHSLYEKEVFRAQLKEVYREQFLPLLEQLMTETLDQYTQQITPAYDRNRIRWNVETEGISAEAEQIRTYLTERTDFLNRLWLEEEEFCILRLQEGGRGGYYGYYAVEPGSCFDALPEKESESFLGWYREDTDAPFDPAEPITEDLWLYPKYEGDEEAAEDQPGLKDLVLQLYHYVPAAVLVLMLLLAAAAVRKREKTKV